MADVTPQNGPGVGSQASPGPTNDLSQRLSERLTELGGVLQEDAAHPAPILRLSIPTVSASTTPTSLDGSGTFKKAPTRRRSSLAWHSPHLESHSAAPPPSQAALPTTLAETWAHYVNWVDDVEDARRGRRYEREGRILKKRVEQPDDSHSDGELEVLNREENIDFDPEADPSGLPLIVDPEGVCYLPDEVIDSAAVFGMNERERTMLMNSHLPENKGPSTFTLSLRKMVNGAPPPPRSTKKRNLLKAIVHTAAAEEEKVQAVADAAAPEAPFSATPDCPLPSPSLLRPPQPGLAPSRFHLKGLQSPEVTEELRNLGRFARVGKYMVHARRFHAMLREQEGGQSPSGENAPAGCGSHASSPGQSPRVSPRVSAAMGDRPLSAGGGPHLRVSDCGPPSRVNSRRISAPPLSRSVSCMSRQDASPLGSLLPPELLPTLITLNDEDESPLPPSPLYHKSVPGLRSPMPQTPPPPHQRHSHQLHSSAGGMGLPGLTPWGYGGRRTPREEMTAGSPDIPEEEPSPAGGEMAASPPPGAPAWGEAEAPARASETEGKHLAAEGAGGDGAG